MYITHTFPGIPGNAERADKTFTNKQQEGDKAMTTTEQVIGFIIVAVIFAMISFIAYELRNALNAEEDDDGNVIRFTKDDEETADGESSGWSWEPSEKPPFNAPLMRGSTEMPQKSHKTQSNQ